MDTLETPSGKNEKTENFPVEKLVGPQYRPHVRAFYAFARAADDISDNPMLTASEKVARLNRFDTALMTPNDDTIPALIPLRESLAETGVTPQHARDLLIAFKRDATKLRYENWEELLDYCRYSAAPVGRYMLDLHGEDKSTWPASDALCTALQIINHIQDCADDYRQLDRVYIPLDMMAVKGATPEALAGVESTPALHETLMAMLDKMGPMVELAQTFASQIRDPRLRYDTAVTTTIAVRLVKLLRERDPLKDDVKLSQRQKLTAMATGFIKMWM
ncbi:MAG: squalene synthase HpnC [Bdellovibrionales bacterium]|jgi:squalene synthase HpnC